MKHVKDVTGATDVKRAVVAGLVLCFVALATPAVAQIPVGSRVGEPPPSAGSYESLGHRDPFVSLIATRRTTTTNSAAPRLGSGLASFFIADVVVTGITGVGNTHMAIVQNVNKQSYVAKVGNRLADGVVKSIDAVSVVFAEFAEPGDVGRPREIRKLLHPVDEVKR